MFMDHLSLALIHYYLTESNCSWHLSLCSEQHLSQQIPPGWGWLTLFNSYLNSLSLYLTANMLCHSSHCIYRWGTTYSGVLFNLVFFCYYYILICLYSKRDLVFIDADFFSFELSYRNWDHLRKEPSFSLNVQSSAFYSDVRSKWSNWFFAVALATCPARAFFGVSCRTVELMSVIKRVHSQLLILHVLFGSCWNWLYHRQHSMFLFSLNCQVGLKVESFFVSLAWDPFVKENVASAFVTVRTFSDLIFCANILLALTSQEVPVSCCLIALYLCFSLIHWVKLSLLTCRKPL